jgi:TRAP-type mannitol/chloroaromatic compound transport system permease small subunit
MEGTSLDVLLRASRLIDAVNERIGRWVAWAIFVAVVISTGNAIIRKTFDMSSNAWLEAQWYLFGAVFMLCSAWTLLANEHIRIDIVNNTMPNWLKQTIEVVGHALFLLPFTLMMIWFSWGFVRISFAQTGVTTAHVTFMSVFCAFLVSCYLFASAIDREARAQSFLFGAAALGLLVAVFVLGAGIRSTWEISQNAGGLIVWPAKFILLLGWILLSAQGLSELVKRIAIIQGRIADVHAAGGHHAAAEAEAERLLQAAKEAGLVAGSDKK